MINDLLIYTHPPASVGPQRQQNPDFQIVQSDFDVVNRVSNAASIVAGIRDQVAVTMLTGGQGGSGLSNQNFAADATLFLPLFMSSRAEPGFATLHNQERVTFSYQNTTAAATYTGLQTVFLGHWPRTDPPPEYAVVRPYTYWTETAIVPPGQTAVLYINIAPDYSHLVHSFLARASANNVLVNIKDASSGYNITNEPAYADNIAYLNLFEVSNYGAPFLPWIAPRKSRFRIEMTNTNSDVPDTVQFGFYGQLVDVPSIK